MKKLTYTITINKPVDLVFNKIMDKSHYADWAKAWGDDMTWEGVFEEGANISFFDTSGQGTKVLVEEVNSNESIKMKHVAMVEAGNKEVTKMDETMQKWIGSREDYFFKALSENETELEVVIVTDEAFEPMMNAWPQALQYFKEICEKN
jgi:uncharacterized protein YndB with AHSA1/START domain